MTTLFKTTKAEDVKVGDVEMQLVEEKRKYVYYYYRAESVFVGEIKEPIYDYLSNQYIGDRILNCVEIVWLPLNYEGKRFTNRYHPSVTLDIASNLENVDDLIQEENGDD